MFRVKAETKRRAYQRGLVAEATAEAIRYEAEGNQWFATFWREYVAEVKAEEVIRQAGGKR